MFVRFIVECILEELMSVLPDLFADNTDADNEHLPANSVCYIYFLFIFRRLMPDAVFVF